MSNEDTEALNEGLNTPTDSDDDAYTPSDAVEEAETEEEVVEEVEDAEVAAATVEASPGEPDDDEEPKPLTRAQQRIQSLANEKRLAEQRAELLERELQAVRQSKQQVQQAQEDENLTDLEKWQRQADQTIRQVQFQNMDMQDRSDFLTSVSKNPAEAAYLDRVEQTLAEARKQGFNPRREDVLIRLMGMDARSKVKQAPAVKREAAQRVKAATGKPVSNKSNVASTKTESTEFDRLRNIRL